MGALDHTLTPFCSVCHQFFGFIPADVRVLQISSDDVRPIFPWPSVLVSAWKFVYHFNCHFQIDKTLVSRLRLPIDFLSPVDIQDASEKPHPWTRYFGLGTTVYVWMLWESIKLLFDVVAAHAVQYEDGWCHGNNNTGVIHYVRYIMMAMVDVVS